MDSVNVRAAYSRQAQDREGENRQTEKGQGKKAKQDDPLSHQSCARANTKVRAYAPRLAEPTRIREDQDHGTVRVIVSPASALHVCMEYLFCRVCGGMPFISRSLEGQEKGSLLLFFLKIVQN